MRPLNHRNYFKYTKNHVQQSQFS